MKLFARRNTDLMRQNQELTEQLAEKEKEVAYLRGNRDFHQLQSSGNYTQARFWEGKFHAVKRENNALRRKLHKQHSSVTATHTDNRETDTSAFTMPTKLAGG